MFIPGTYGVALLMMVLSMLCWGSWPNAQKLVRPWRFELFYWDFIWGILLMCVLLGATLGSTDPGSPESFMANLASADRHHVLLALAGGALWNVCNLLLVAAIAMAGLAVAFPIGIGLALVIATTLNYLVTPAGNPRLIFTGVALIVMAIVLDALAYRRISPSLPVSAKGILLSVCCGLGMGFYYPLVAKAIKGPHHLGPYSVAYIFGLGALACTLPLNYALMRRPIAGPPLSWFDYLKGSKAVHFWGVVGGLIWGVGTVSNFVASYVRIVGPAASYAFGQGTLVAALWGVFVWKEFAGASRGTKHLLALMFAFFIGGVLCVALAPIK